MTAPYGKQDQRKINLVCQLACQREQRLLVYQGFWPIKDFLKVMLHRNIIREGSRARSKSRL
ncbi:hypothetical protein AURDEDRAFT_178541 [Auricularia subglabra TFB-10046 SS5]|uniref:Uncharacterized protein n=1 Tax=Auricularia subglabra (strain TFB-10046 / SS5) TaxID=717982 RepID=J0D1C4_AURST|nr:hypothetical protein AURDEDRAFT_178541 [Auricularia subglabra TFB-10046 SS5]